jgi:small subunit ribosomal protein S21
MHGAIDAFEQMAKSKEPMSLADRLHNCMAPVRLLIGASHSLPQGSYWISRVRKRTHIRRDPRGWRWRRPLFHAPRNQLTHGLPLLRSVKPLSSKDGKMTEVRLNEGDSVDRALKLFRKKLQKIGLFKELRRRRFYVKPSAARLIKSAEARRRKRKRHQAYD